MSNFPKPPGVPEYKVDKSVSLILDACLSPEHRSDPAILRFVQSYVACRDDRQAASEAGFDPKHGRGLKNRPDVWAAITELTKLSVMRYGFDAHEIVEKVKEVVDVDPIGCLRPDGSYKHLHEMEPALRRAIRKMKVKNVFEKDPNGMDVVTGEILEIEFWDKLKSAELLGREVDTFKEKKVVEHSVTDKMAEVLLEKRKKLEERDVLEIEGRKA